MQKIAIVGFGAMGQMHSKCYQLIPNADLVAIVDAHPEDAKKKQKKLGIKTNIYSSLAELFESEDVDAVDICLPTDLHVPLGLEAVEAGKHVFCEKPFAPTAEVAKKLVEAARKKRRFLMVGHCIRFWPEYQYLEEMVKEKKHGKLLSLTLRRRSSRPMYSKQNWLQNLKRSGGAVYDLHIHDTDFVQHLFGRPKAVTSVGTKDAAGWSHVFTTYHYKNVAVTAEGGWNFPPKFGFSMSYEAVFEDAVLEFDYTWSPTLRLTAGNRPPKEISLKSTAVTSAGEISGNISSLGGYINELQYFVNCLEKKTAPKISTGVHGMEAVETIAAEVKSLESGKTVALKK
jgi:predicted dehydrogenase